MSRAKPRLTLLSTEQINQVHEYSLEILATTGVRVDSPRARAVFERAIGRSADNDRVHIPRETVAWALSVAPARVAIYDRRGAPAFTLDAAGQDGTRFGIGVTNLYYQEPETDAVVLFTREHMARCTRLGHALPGFDVISTIGILHDIPPEQADLVGTLEMIANTTKPLVVLVSGEAAFEPVLDLLESLRGDLAARPFAIPYANPVTPLVINAGTSDKLFSAIGRGLPVIYANYGMAGATTPITPGGTLALLNAELLAGLVLAQLIREGTPVILGSLPASFDMRAMMSYYSAETMLLNLACGEMMAHYGVPHCGTSGSGGGWGADLLAADGFWLNHLTACVGAVGLAPFVGGNFDSLAFSPTAAVYADHIIRQARRFADGFALDPAATGLAEIDQVGPGGNFLTTLMTLRLFRQADFRSPIFPRLSLEAWQAQGSPKAGDLLRARAVDLLAHAPPPDDHAELIGARRGVDPGLDGRIAPLRQPVFIREPRGPTTVLSSASALASASASTSASTSALAYVSPCSWANSAAWVRSRRPRRLRMLETWFLTVPSLTTSRSAISRFVAPVPMRRSTSSSRSVRSFSSGAGAGQRQRRPLRQSAQHADQLTGHRRFELIDARVGQLHRARQLRRRDIFQQIADRSCAQRLDDVFLVIEGGQHDHLAAGQLPVDLGRGHDAIHDGHADVHQDDIGVQRQRFFDGFLAVDGLTDHADALLDVQQRRDAFTHQALIVHDQDRHAADALSADAIGTHAAASCESFLGTVTVSSVPSWGSLLIFICPLTNSRRSWSPWMPKP